MFRLVLFLLLVLDSHLFRCLIFCFPFFFLVLLVCFLFAWICFYYLSMVLFLFSFLFLFLCLFLFGWLGFYYLPWALFVCYLLSAHPPPPNAAHLAGLDSQARNQAWAPVMGAPSCWTTREVQAPGNINWCAFSLRSSSQHQDRAWPNYLQGPILDASGQTINKTGTQPYYQQKWGDREICYTWRSKVKTYKTK